jgi:indole-3-glycerol phosphate synthase
LTTFNCFREAKRLEIKALQRLESRGFPPPYAGRRPPFSLSLTRAAADQGLAIIAEYKRASPSQGDIAPELAAGRVARAYAEAGATAMSILTEKSKFKGRLNFIREARAVPEAASLPLLRKDFIFDLLQVRATAATPASAVLLIVGLTPSAALLRQLREEAENLGLEAVVEVLNETDLEIARDSGAKIIQANARDFADLSVDLRRSLSLAQKHARAAGELWIAASGFNRPEELRLAREAGFTAILAGTALMAGGQPAESLKKLRAGLG